MRSDASFVARTIAKDCRESKARFCDAKVKLDPNTDPVLSSLSEDVAEEQTVGETSLPPSAEGALDHSLSNGLGEESVEPSVPPAGMSQSSPHGNARGLPISLDRFSTFTSSYSDSHVRETQKATEARGHLLMYAEDIMSAQRRTHLYEVWVGRCESRFFYYGHSAVVPSAKFNFCDRPDIMLAFFLCLANGSRSDSGNDESYRIATGDEVSKYHVKEKLKDWSPDHDTYLWIDIPDYSRADKSAL